MHAGSVFRNSRSPLLLRCSILLRSGSFEGQVVGCSAPSSSSTAYQLISSTAYQLTSSTAYLSIPSFPSMLDVRWWTFDPSVSTPPPSHQLISSSAYQLNSLSAQQLICSTAYQLISSSAHQLISFHPQPDEPSDYIFCEHHFGYQFRFCRYPLLKDYLPQSV